MTTTTPVPATGPAIPDQAVRDLVARDGLHRTLFVDAGAGTGKTSTLVARVESLVLTDGVPLSAIAAITFTEAAARELQDRIRVAFEERSETAADPIERARSRQAVSEVDLAAITTLHGFARRILAQHPVDVGLPPTVEILDEISSVLAVEDRWNRFVDRLHADPELEPLLVRAVLLDVDLEPRYPGHATLRDVATKLSQSWDLLAPIAERDDAPLEPVDLGELAEVVDRLEDDRSSCTDPADKLHQRLTTVLAELRAIVDEPDADRALERLVDTTVSPGAGGKGSAWGGRDGVDAVKARIRAADEVRASIADRATEDVLQQLLTLVCREVRDAAEARRAEGRLEFHDLLVLARELLRTSPAARASLHDRYARLLLDEFQDTDPIQIELAVLIASTAPVDPSDVPAWHDVEVPDGRLFFVGDPKQSIYRFRRADIALYLAARHRFGDGGGACSLTTNFRTVPAVVEWTNALFGAHMGEGVPDSQPAYEALRAHRMPAPDTDHRPVVLGGPHDDIKAGELRAIEATNVAGAVHAIRRAPDEWPVWDRDEARWRPAALRDITILIPTRTSLPYLRDALEHHDLPYRLDTGTLVYDSQEVRDVLAVVRLVADPTDELALVAALRSTLYGCSDPELVRFRLAGGRWDLRAPVPDTLPADDAVGAALGHLRSLHERRWWDSPSELVARILDERQAFLLAFGTRRPKEVWRRLRFLADQARLHDETVGGDLHAFLAWAELQQADAARVHEPLLPETDDDALRIMTIHGSKGLEFPITIVSGTTTEQARRRRGVSVLWDGDIPAVKVRSGVATGNHDARADLEDAMDEHERERLLYVACTRARDHLLVACDHKAGARQPSYASAMWETMGRDPRSRTLSATPDPGPEPAGRPTPPAVADDRAAWRRRRDALLDGAGTSRVRSATALAAALDPGESAHPSNTDAPGDDQGDDTAEVDADGTGAEVLVSARRRGRAGSAIGRAVHACLQVVDLDDPAEVDALAAHHAGQEAVPEATGLIAAMVHAALGSEALALARANPHHRELYVAAPVGAGTTIEGYVDLLVETPDGLVIVDHKTDGGDVEVALDRYRHQGAAYAVALEAATGLPVAEVRFVFCRPDGADERTVDDLAAAMERVRAHVGVQERPT